MSISDCTALRERRDQLIRRNSHFPTERPPYGERCLIIGRLQDLGAPKVALDLLQEWSRELCRTEAAER